VSPKELTPEQLEKKRVYQREWLRNKRAQQKTNKEGAPMTVQADNLVAVQKALTGVEVKFLGDLLWYTVVDCAVTLDDLKAKFDANGLDAKFLPSPIGARDAFRLATKEAETHKHPLEQGKFLNLLVRDVHASRNELVRQIVREVVDASNKRLEFTPVFKMVLTKEDLAIDPLVDEPSAEEQAAAQRVELAYTEGRTHYNGGHVRDMVKNALLTCDRVSVRPSGGVHFVPKQHQPVVVALQGVLKGLNEFRKSDHHMCLWHIPVIDAAEQRQMLEESLADQVEAESEALVKEMDEYIKDTSKTLTVAAAKKFADKVRGVRDLVKKYEDMLETELTTSQATLEVCEQQAMMLLERVDTEVPA
jgi:hypothetical protein